MVWEDLQSKFGEKMEKVDAYKANDGTLHQTETECKAHEIGIQWRNTVNIFLNSSDNPYPSHAHRSIAANVIVHWETFKAKAKE